MSLVVELRTGILFISVMSSLFPLNPSAAALWKVVIVSILICFPVGVTGGKLSVSW